MNKKYFLIGIFACSNFLGFVGQSFSSDIATTAKVAAPKQQASMVVSSTPANVISSIDSNQASSVIDAAIKSRLKVALPSVKVDKINKTMIPGLYEVIAGKKVFYANETGQYILIGNLVDLNTKRSLTQQKVDALSMVDWNQLPLNLAIRHVNGNGQRKIAVFTDPECPFCKQLDQETLPKLQNVTIYYFLFPLAMHANAKTDAQKIVCSETPEKTYLAWMKDGTALPAKTECAQAKSLAVIERVGTNVVGVDATPLIVLPNGALVSGLVPEDHLNKLIDEASPSTVPSAKK